MLGINSPWQQSYKLNCLVSEREKNVGQNSKQGTHPTQSFAVHTFSQGLLLINYIYWHFGETGLCKSNFQSSVSTRSDLNRNIAKSFTSNVTSSE